MFNIFLQFITLFASLSIQFGAVTFPVDIVSLNASHEALADTIAFNISQTVNCPEFDSKYLIIMNRTTATQPYYCYAPGELLGLVDSSSITLDSRNATSGMIHVNSVGWYRFTINQGGGVAAYNALSGSGSFSFYLDSSKLSGGLVFNGYYTLPKDGIDTFIVDTPGFDSVYGGAIGSLTPTGHSSGSGLDGLSNTSSFGSVSVTGHSSGNSIDTTGLTGSDLSLGHIVNNTDLVVQNTFSISNALNTINNNIINGFGAVFNAISVFNDNFLQTFIYDQAQCEEIIENSHTYEVYTGLTADLQTAQQSIADFVEDYTESTQLVDELAIPIDFTPWTFGSDYGRVSPFNQVYIMRFGFLDETKALWQPLFLALLYFCLGWNIFFQIPNIIWGYSDR